MSVVCRLCVPSKSLFFLSFFLLLQFTKVQGKKSITKKIPLEKVMKGHWAQHLQFWPIMVWNCPAEKGWFNHSSPGRSELLKALGEGRSALQLEMTWKWWKTDIIKFCHNFIHLKIGINKAGLLKEKCLKKELGWKLARGVQICPPPVILGLLKKMYTRVFHESYFFFVFSQYPQWFIMFFHWI